MVKISYFNNLVFVVLSHFAVEFSTPLPVHEQIMKIRKNSNLDTASKENQLIRGKGGEEGTLI